MIKQEITLQYSEFNCDNNGQLNWIYSSRIVIPSSAAYFSMDSRNSVLSSYVCHHL